MIRYEAAPDSRAEQKAPSSKTETKRQHTMNEDLARERAASFVDVEVRSGFDYTDSSACSCDRVIVFNTW